MNLVHKISLIYMIQIQTCYFISDLQRMDFFLGIKYLKITFTTLITFTIQFNRAIYQNKLS